MQILLAHGKPHKVDTEAGVSLSCFWGSEGTFRVKMPPVETSEGRKEARLADFSVGPRHSEHLPATSVCVFSSASHSFKFGSATEKFAVGKGGGGLPFFFLIPFGMPASAEKLLCFSETLLLPASSVIIPPPVWPSVLVSPLLLCIWIIVLVFLS